MCRACNSTAGNTWDAELARQQNSLCLFFNIVRDRGEPPGEPIKTTAGERLKMLPGGGFVLLKPEFSETPNENGAHIRIVARDRREAKKMLQGLARKYKNVDVAALLADTSSSQSYPEGLVHLALDFGGEAAGRSIVKSAVAIAHYAGIPVEAADIAVSYLRDPNAPVCFGYFYERDLIHERPTGVPLHCVAIEGDPTTGLLLGYVEYFGFRRVVVCLSKSYSGPFANYVYAIDPCSGESLPLVVKLPFTSDDIEEIYDYKRIPNGSMEKAFREVVEIAIRRQFEREQQRMIADAVEYAFANCGAKKGDQLTEEQTAKLGRLLVERMTPYLARHIRVKAPRP